MLKQTAKLLLATSLSLGTIWSSLPGHVQAEASIGSNIDSASQAIQVATALHLIPVGATANAKLNSGIWNITFEVEPALAGSIRLFAKDGQVVEYSAYMRSSFIGIPSEDPNDESLMKYSVKEVEAIAAEFLTQQDWKLPDGWMPDPYPEAIINTRFDIGRLHHVRFNRSHDGIRSAEDTVTVTVDRWTGKINSYLVKWEARTYSPNRVSDISIMDTNMAGKLLYNKIDPFLKWQAIEDPDKPQLVYALHEEYRMTVDGNFPKEYQWENPSFTDKVEPSYSSDSAKKRLLSMYTLDLEYIDGKLAYRLRLQPGISFFIAGWHPVIDAKTGQWLDFLNKPIKELFPPAADWLIEAAPAEPVGYAAAVVWDHELLQLQDEPYIERGYTLVPFRSLLTKLGAKITWDSAARKVTASKGNTHMELTVDSNRAKINGMEKQLEAPARIKNGRTYIPARLVLETFGLKVSWNKDARLVFVSNPSDDLPAPAADQLQRYRFQAQLNWENNLHK